MKHTVLFNLTNPYLAVDATSPLPTEFCLFKFGVNRAYHIGDGDSEIDFNANDAARIMAAFLDTGHDIPIDWNHNMLSDDVEADKSAAGWFKPELREDGLYATSVTWTPPAEEKLKSRQYRYFSPAVELDEYDGEIGMSRLLPAALTNLPALKNIKPLVNNSGTKHTVEINLKKDTNMSEIETFSAADMKVKDEALNKALAEIEEMKINSVLDKAVTEGKLAPAKKAEFAAIGKESGLKTLNLLLSALPVQLPKAPVMEKTAAEADKSEELSAYQLSVAAKLGLTAEQFIAERKKTDLRLSQALNGKTPEGNGLTVDQTKGKETARKLSYFIGIK